MAKKKYYAVKKGKTPGIYMTWDDCKAQVDGFSGAIYKSFGSIAEAAEFLGEGYENVAGSKNEQMILEAELSELENTKETTKVERRKNVTSETEAVAYVDGSYNVLTEEYACGVVLFSNGEEIHISEKGEDDSVRSMRNVAGEILGAKRAMEYCVANGIKSLSIYHDYQGIASWCLGEWKTNKDGTIAYKQYYDSIKNQLEVRFVKVKGHSGDQYNDLADELAKRPIFN